MTTPRQDAEANVKDFARKLMRSALDREQEVVRSTKGGEGVLGILAAYTTLLRQLTSHCADRFVWVDKQPDVERDWNHGETWKDFSFGELRELYEYLNNRLNPVVSQFGGATTAVTEAMSRFVTILFEVQTDLAHELNARVHDSKGKEIRKQTERADQWTQEKRKIIWTAVLAAVGSLIVGLLIGLAHAKPPQTNSCQSSSNVASSTPAPTPQTSDTPPPSTPPSADLPRASHPDLAKSSSTK